MSKKKKQVRDAFRTAVFKRDGHKCVFCDNTEELDAHHITDRNVIPNGGYVKENGITLCPVHHIMAEEYHVSKGEEHHEGMHPLDLYKKIGSSHEEAIEASKRLK